MKHSSPTKRRSLGALAGVALLALGATTAAAATLSGNVLYSGGGLGTYYVYVVRLTIDSPIAGMDILHHAGRWEVRNIPDGNYFIFAWRDMNGNFIPSRGEPAGFYGDPLPQRITVSGADVTGLDITLQTINIAAELRGRVGYAGNKTGRIWIVPHVMPELTLANVRGTPWTMTQPGEYQTFVFLNGTYYVTAYMDVNGNLIHDAGEPLGTSNAVDVVITPGVTYFDVDIALRVNSTPVESRTWSEIKGLYGP